MGYNYFSDAERYYVCRCRVCRHVYSTTEDEDVAIHMRDWISKPPFIKCTNCGALYAYEVVGSEGRYGVSIKSPKDIKKPKIIKPKKLL
ncbi:MAG: hypothetical protein QXM83_04135 [Ignisphaera sp.]